MDDWDTSLVDGLRAIKRDIKTGKIDTKELLDRLRLAIKSAEELTGKSL
jgi:hypothetical protein